MTNDDRSLERAARTWLEAGPTQAPDRAVEGALHQIQDIPQERGLRIPWRLPTMNPIPRLAAAAVIVTIAVGAGAYLLRPQDNTGGPQVSPSPSPNAPGLSPRPTAVDASPVAWESKLFTIPIAMTFGDGWRLDSERTIDVDLQHGITDLGISRLDVTTVPGEQPADPFVPFPADLAAWLSQRPEFGPVTVHEVTIGGRPGTLIDADFTWDGKSDTKFLRYGSVAWNYDQATAGQRGRWIVLPGAGDTGVVIFMESPIAGFEATAASLDRLLATLTFR